ncbi:hypothetical protein JQ559_35970 [Bradyrhizobium viridifuturi]|jgi:hypothetical protein|uniref:hypothetical protein n=1 Tax=Bradyrhizobium sp. TaxID=376 RepID=UPI000397E74A|nr:MAG: hypothetical protein C207_07127 [Bradyrhizobium sp. DFCI-1]MBR1025294.1 hypothetical protein [Bradyrhizobium viridifuturi]MCA3793020.1 hypothetical protein [Burkholderia sp.]QRI70067.1 hypothetical protein JQ507_00520 [Bradyrhizobium sp. PSBB068]MBR1042004.1 hypothetical protein [Bradyrhizobium viridifuturi]
MSKPEDVAKALEELEKAGAKIHEGDAKGKKVTASVIGDIRKGVSPQFDAWVSWTKSF